MYQCSVCGLGVLVRELETPIRACNCTIKKERKPENKKEKFLSFFGKKYFIERLAPISMIMEASLEGKSTLKG